MKSRSFSSLAVILGLTLAPAAATAQEEEDLSELEGMLDASVVTSASKTAETASSAPATATIVSAEELQRYGIRTVDQAILFLGYGVTTSESHSPPEFVARGVRFTTDLNSHVLILVDGHAINSQTTGGANLDRGMGLPIELVDHIEIILGPGSVLYGTNAMLAVVNVVTKRAKDYRGIHLGVDTELADAPSLYRGTTGLGQEFDLWGEPAGLTLQLEYSYLHDPVDIPEQYLTAPDAYTGQPVRFSPDGPATGIWGGTWDNNVYWQPAAYSRLVVGRFELAAAAGKIERNHPQLQFDFDNPETREMESWVRLDARQGLLLSEQVDFRMRVYADSDRKKFLWRSSAAQYCLPGQLNGCRTDNVGGSEWLGLELQSDLDWLADGSLTTLLGVDGRIRNAAFVSDIIDAETGENPGSVAYDSRVDQTVGLYGQQVAQLHADVTLNAGARFDYDSRFGSALSPRAAAVFAPWDGGSLKGIYASAFRTPTPTEQGIANPLQIVPADPLDPEHVRSIEGVIEQRFGTHRLLTALFRSWWEDMVVLAPLTEQELDDARAAGQLALFVPNGYQYRNAASVDNWGINFGYEGAVVGRRLRYALNWTAASARRFFDATREDERLPDVPQTYGNARVSYDFGGPWPIVGAAARYKGRQTLFNVEPGDYPYQPMGPARLVLQANVTGPAPGIPGLRYRLGMRWASTADSATAIGPLRVATARNPEPTLAQLETFRVLAGLQYNLQL